MYCRFCGTEISDQSQFCTSCGRPQDSIKRSTANICPTVLRYIIGVLFIIGGSSSLLVTGRFIEVQ